MDQPAVIALIVAAGLGLMATLLILRRQRKVVESENESQFGVSTEGEKRCPNCGMGNLWTENRCIACKAPLRG